MRREECHPPVGGLAHRSPGRQRVWHLPSQGPIHGRVVVAVGRPSAQPRIPVRGPVAKRARLPTTRASAALDPAAFQAPPRTRPMLRVRSGARRSNEAESDGLLRRARMKSDGVPGCTSRIQTGRRSRSSKPDRQPSGMPGTDVARDSKRPQSADRAALRFRKYGGRNPAN